MPVIFSNNPVRNFTDWYIEFYDGPNRIGTGPLLKPQGVAGAFDFKCDRMRLSREVGGQGFWSVQRRPPRSFDPQVADLVFIQINQALPSPPCYLILAYGPPTGPSTTVFFDWLSGQAHPGATDGAAAADPETARSPGSVDDRAGRR